MLPFIKKSDTGSYKGKKGFRDHFVEVIEYPYNPKNKWHRMWGKFQKQEAVDYIKNWSKGISHHVRKYRIRNLYGKG